MAALVSACTTGGEGVELGSPDRDDRMVSRDPSRSSSDSATVALDEDAVLEEVRGRGAIRRAVAAVPGYKTGSLSATLPTPSSMRFISRTAAMVLAGMV